MKHQVLCVGGNGFAYSTRGVIRGDDGSDSNEISSMIAAQITTYIEKSVRRRIPVQPRFQQWFGDTVFVSIKIL